MMRLPARLLVRHLARRIPPCLISIAFVAESLGFWITAAGNALDHIANVKKPRLSDRIGGLMLSRNGAIARSGQMAKARPAGA